MDHAVRSLGIGRFGPFEFDSRSGELRKSGSRVRLQEQPGRLLTVLLVRAGDVVTREELQEKLWSADTFVDFDHSLNTAIRKLRTALDDSAETPRFIETLARHGYRFIAPVEWAVGSRAPRVAPWIVIAAFVLLIVTAAALYLRRASPAPLAIHTIGVLPFANTDRDTEYLSEGLPEALIDELSTWPELRVVSRTSAFRFKGKIVDPRAIGRQLNVEAVVTGNIQRTADEYQLHVELIDVNDGAELWSKHYRTRLGDLDVLQRHVAADMAFRLGLTRADDARLRRKPSPAYDLYLRGRYLWNRRGRDNVLRATAYFEQAVQVDPQFALAYAGLANAYGVTVGNSYMPGSEDALQQKANAAANRALSLDPTIAEAYASRAAAKSTYYWDFEGAERDFRRAIELKPNYAQAHAWYSELLYRTGRLGEARRESDLAYELEPYSKSVNGYVCWNRLNERQYAEAIAFCRRTGDVDQDLVNKRCLQWCQLLNGQYDDAIATIRTSNPAAADELADAIRRGGREAFWKKRVEQYEQRNDKYAVAACYAALGDADNAFAFLDKAYKQRELDPVFYVDPSFDNLRSDPRFDELARRIGLPQVRAKSR